MFEAEKILQYLKKSFSRKDVLILVGLITLFFATRLINLDKFPIFTDEGIYIRWARVAWHDAAWRFISLTDGRQPLQTWATIPFLKFFPNNLLLGGRLFGVFSGLFALVGMFSLAYYLFGKKTAYMAGLLYTIVPYFLFYDRMALADSLVNGFAIWILLFSIILIRTVRLDVALMFGFLAGMGLLTKSSVKMFLALSVFAPISTIADSKNINFKKITNFIILFFGVGFIALLFYNVQRLSPFFNFVSQKNATFVMPLSEFLKTPFNYLYDNAKSVPFFVFSELAYVVGFIGLVGLYLIYKKDKGVGLYLISWIILPYIIISFFTKLLFPRYIIFFGSILIIGAADLLSNLKDAQKKSLILAVIILSIVYFDYTIIFDQTKIPFPPIDRGQYIEGVPAGTGIKEIIDFARDKSYEKKVVILSEGNFGVAGDMLEASLARDDKNIEIKGYWPLDEKELRENQSLLKENYVYVVFSHRTEFYPMWPIKLIKKYDKPGGKSSFNFFELTP